MPTFGDPSGNQQFTMHFHGVVEGKNVKEARKGGPLEEPQSKKTTNAVKKPSDEKDDHSKHLKAKDHNGMKSENDRIKSSTPHPYQGRLGNPASSYPQKPSGNTAQPTVKQRSASSLPSENHAKAMEFRSWEQNPKVPITAAFDIAAGRTWAKLSMNDPALHSDSTPSHKISNDDYKKVSWWSRFNPKKLWKSFCG